MLRNPGATIDELMEIIPAPDFPTAGIIMTNIFVILKDLFSKPPTDSQHFGCYSID
jgi:hypothetical protein